MAVNIVHIAKQYAENLLINHIPSNYTYHNIHHTRDVVQGVLKIGEGSKITFKQLEILQVAAWFHDTGYIHSYYNHEEESKHIADEFLSRYNVDKPFINQVIACIDATKMPQEPVGLLPSILADSDLFHLADDQLFHRSDNLKKEWDSLKNEAIDKMQYLENSYIFFSKHEYHTEFACKHLSPKKNKNILKLINMIIEAKIEYTGLRLERMRTKAV